MIVDDFCKTVVTVYWLKYNAIPNPNSNNMCFWNAYCAWTLTEVQSILLAAFSLVYEQALSTRSYQICGYETVQRGVLELMG